MEPPGGSEEPPGVLGSAQAQSPRGGEAASSRAAPAATSTVLRLRGLPFAATANDITEFFSGYELVESYICKRNGRSTGEAYAVFTSEEQAARALQELNRKFLGPRYVELFESSVEGLEAVKRILEDVRLQGHVVRLRGLPYRASVADVVDFFSGLATKDGERGVSFISTADGRPSGEAFVEFEDEPSLFAALERHRQPLGRRYVEIFQASKLDMLQAVHRSRWQKPPLVDAATGTAGTAAALKQMALGGSRPGSSSGGNAQRRAQNAGAGRDAGPSASSVGERSSGGGAGGGHGTSSASGRYPPAGQGAAGGRSSATWSRATASASTAGAPSVVGVTPGMPSLVIPAQQAAGVPGTYPQLQHMRGPVNLPGLPARGGYMYAAEGSSRAVLGYGAVWQQFAYPAMQAAQQGWVAYNPPVQPLVASQGHPQVLPLQQSVQQPVLMQSRQVQALPPLPPPPQQQQQQLLLLAQQAQVQQQPQLYGGLSRARRGSGSSSMQQDERGLWPPADGALSRPSGVDPKRPQRHGA